jgi:transcriptional regulator with XRE-family HTH domain
MPLNKLWFQERLRSIKLSQRQLAIKIGLDPAAVSYMLSGKRTMSMDEAKSIADVLLVPVTEVMRQAGIDVLDDVRKVPIAGHVNARGMVSLLPRGTHDHIIAPADVPVGSFCLQMRAVNSPRDGWLYFISGEQAEVGSCIDRFCVVALKDGALMLATVKRGYKRELYNLVLMGDGEPAVLENKELMWGARVLWILPT